MEDAFIIKGGKRLSGYVELSGAKNVALKVLIAALLFDGEVILKNIPKINDVIELLHLINGTGAHAEFIDDHTVRVDSRGMKHYQLDMLHASKVRVSFLFFAPLLYKFGKAEIPNPGGCRIGARPIDRTVEGLKHLGISLEYVSDNGYYHAKMDSSPTGKYRFIKSSVTATELLIMMGVFTKSGVTIENSALEPEVDDLINFLNKGGAKIKRMGTSIVINTADHLVQTEPYSIMPDRIEAGTYIALALATRGEITTSHNSEEAMKKFHEKLLKAGVSVEKERDNTWHYIAKNGLKAVDINTQPHPGFMTDWQPIWSVLMTQAEGTSIIQERIYENRFAYVEELRKLGADIDFVRLPIINPAEYFFFNFDPNKKYNQAIRVVGPQQLHNGVVKVNDLRAGATLAIATLTAEGESVVNGASILERGYENFVEKITQLGGDVKKV
jgi:UDP-N-acetylglucosamine 1-carboxyvinyltransferase